MEADDLLKSPAGKSNLWLLLVRGLLLVAMAIGSYLAWVSLHSGHVAGCGVEAGCNAVLQSRWAYWMNLPVSIPAVLVYVALFGATILLQKNTAPDDQRGSWAAIIILSVMVVGSAFWFVGLQVLVIQSFCKFCLTAHACGFAAALLCLMNIPYATDPDTPMWAPGSGKRGVPRQAMLSLITLGLAGVAVLAAGQIVLPQKERNIVKVIANTPPPANSVAVASTVPNEISPPPPNAQLIAPRTVSLYSNQFIIHFDDVPVLGSPDAKHVIVCLFDYTCGHCRALHPILKRVSEHFSNELAMVCLPVSLSPDCNPFIPKRDAHANPNSCPLARLGLAVWRAKPEVHQQYDDWVFSSVRPPTIEQAQQYAEQLIGADKLKAALQDPWVSQQLLFDCKLHRANWIVADDSGMPQIVMGNAVSSGPINSVQHLSILLDRYMDLHLAPNGH